MCSATGARRSSRPKACSPWRARRSRAKIQELKVIQQNQVAQKNLQEKLVEQQVENVKMQTDITYIHESLSKIDVRITEAFKTLEKKVDKDTIPKPEALVTKADVGRLMAYTSGLIVILFAVIEFAKRSWGF